MTKSVKRVLFLVSGFAVAAAAGFAEKNSMAEISQTVSAWRMWCDGFFISAVLFLSVGFLHLVSCFGGFDALKYACVRFWGIFSVSARKYRSYFDYVNSKKRRKIKFPFDMFMAGSVMLAGAFVCLLFCG